MDPRSRPSWALVCAAVLAAGCGGPSGPSRPDARIDLIGPSSVPVGSAEFILTVVGDYFTDSSVVRFDGFDRPTLLRSRGRLDARIYTSDVMEQGTASVVVYTPGNGVSNEVTFGIGQPSGAGITVASVTPEAGMLGAGDTEITVLGSNFLPGSKVLLDANIQIATTRVSNTELRATVPAAVLAEQGRLDLQVWYASAITSSPVTWEVRAPVPTVTALTPSSAVVGSAPVVLRVQGTGFIPRSWIWDDGGSRSTTYVSPTEVTMMLTDNDLGRLDTLHFSVRNPAPGGGASAELPFVVTEGP